MEHIKVINRYPIWKRIWCLSDRFGLDTDKIRHVTFYPGIVAEIKYTIGAKTFK